MKSYVYKRNKDGIHYLDLAKTWEKLMVAARVVAAAQSKCPKDVLVSLYFSFASRKRQMTSQQRARFVFAAAINLHSPC